MEAVYTYLSLSTFVFSSATFGLFHSRVHRSRVKESINVGVSMWEWKHID